MLVKEGDFVKAGTPLATMSSTDRATLIDAARGKGPEELKYWQDVYKPIQLIAPMDATVIVATLQPGQVVAVTDPIVVLSDQLIVQAQVDETDIRRIKIGQKATVTLDSFPNDIADAQVEHIYYESIVQSNVTVYKVDLVIADVPDFFRSGMNAQVAFEFNSSRNALVLPADTVKMGEDGKGAVVILDDNKKQKTVEVTTGIVTDKLVEIKSGLDENARVVITSKKLNLSAGGGGKNPFMPQFGQRKAGGNGGGR
jgi:macrolide-specific efflux system membrane fusion protein